MSDERVYWNIPQPFVGCDGVPRCHEECQNLEGTRCQLLGLRAHIGLPCEPAVADLVSELRLRRAQPQQEWALTGFVRETQHGAMVITVDGDSATAMFREQVKGACVEHELLGPDGETVMSVGEAIRVCNELVEDLDAGRLFDRSYGRRS